MKPRQCPACHGMGGWEDTIDFWIGGPWEVCGFCNGTGEIKSKKFFYKVLGWESWNTRRMKADRMARLGGEDNA